MREVKIKGRRYIVNKTSLRYYDRYYLKGKIYERCPIDVDVIGYVRVGEERIGVCKPIHKWIMPVVLGFTGLLAVGVVCAGVFVFTRTYSVTPWEQKVATGDDVIGELDDGTAKVSKKFAYSRYVTYDGTNVSLFYDTKDTKYEVAVGVDDNISEYYPISSGYRIPMTLDMNVEDVCDGVLYLRKGNSIDEYPLVIEYLGEVETVAVAQGETWQQEVAYNAVVETVGEVGGYDEPVDAGEVGGMRGSLNISGITDEGIHTDFENFQVIAPKKPWYEDE